MTKEYNNKSSFRKIKERKFQRNKRKRKEKSREGRGMCPSHAYKMTIYIYKREGDSYLKKGERKKEEKKMREREC